MNLGLSFLLSSVMAMRKAAPSAKKENKIDKFAYFHQKDVNLTKITKYDETNDDYVIYEE